MKKGFTLIELLVVIAIIALLMGILLPVTSRVRLQSRVLNANSDLRQISISIRMYTEDNNGKHPPTRLDCNLGWEDHVLPPELARYGYLPKPEPDTGMSVNMEDVFSRGHTYKYWSVGQHYRNGKPMFGQTMTRPGYGPPPDMGNELWVPNHFPNNDPKEGIRNGKKYSDPLSSPVTWVLFSKGPDYDWWNLKIRKYPVPRVTWYSPEEKKGIITRVKLKDGKEIGTFKQ